jgi:hypothetical protein
MIISDSTNLLDLLPSMDVDLGYGHRATGFDKVWDMGTALAMARAMGATHYFTETVSDKIAYGGRLTLGVAFLRDVQINPLSGRASRAVQVGQWNKLLWSVTSFGTSGRGYVTPLLGAQIGENVAEIPSPV